MKNIFIITEPRTGSNLLCETFYCFQPTRIINELFLTDSNENNLAIKTLIRDNEKELLYKELNLSNLKELSNFFVHNPKQSLILLDQIIPITKVYKIHDWQLDMYDLDFILEESAIVLLTRKQKIYQYASFEIAKQLNQWHSIDTNHIQITVNPEHYVEWKTKSYNYYNNIKSRLKDRNYLELNYEDHLENINTDQLLKDINDWLNDIDLKLTLGDYRPKIFKKQNLRHISDIVKNYDQIYDIL